MSEALRLLAFYGILGAFFAGWLYATERLVFDPLRRRFDRSVTPISQPIRHASAHEPWKCAECGGDDLSFDRSLCACGSMHYFCGDCGVQDDSCSPVAGGPGDTT